MTNAFAAADNDTQKLFKNIALNLKKYSDVAKSTMNELAHEFVKTSDPTAKALYAMLEVRIANFSRIVNATLSDPAINEDTRKAILQAFPDSPVPVPAIEPPTAPVEVPVAPASIVAVVAQPLPVVQAQGVGGVFVSGESLQP